MATNEYAWTGLAVGDGVAVTSANINNGGNGDTLAWATAGTAGTYLYSHSGLGDGVSITGVATTVARLDTPSNLNELGAYQCVFVASAPPTTANADVIAARNATGFMAHIYHSTTGAFLVANASAATQTGGTSPATVNGHAYQLDLAVMYGTTTTSGRIIARIRSLTAPTVWNGGSEFYLDTGYTVNAGTTQSAQARIGKVGSASVTPEFKILNLRWKDSDTPNTSTTKSSAILNFLGVSGPSITSATSGDYYVMQVAAAAGAGGALTYSIAQTSGTAQTPVLLGPGVWRVTRNASGPLGYTVTVTEAGGGSTTSTFVVPQAVTAQSFSGQFRRRVLTNGVLV